MFRPAAPRPPRLGAALSQYRRRAPYYDFELALFEPLRRKAVERLGLQEGEAVLDIGCGTGLSFGLLHDGVGPRGRITGIEPCPEMSAQARQRVSQQGWRNVTLLDAAAEDVTPGASADAALFMFTHDVLTTPRALANVLQGLRPGARIVACGLQWTRSWAWPLNALVLGAALHSVSSLAGLDAPWRPLTDRLDNPRVDGLLAGAVYLASGALRSTHPC